MADLEPLLALLQAQPERSEAALHARYVLLLWLSLVCRLPFQMRVLDSSAEQVGSLFDARSRLEWVSACICSRTQVVGT